MLVYWWTTSKSADIGVSGMVWLRLHSLRRTHHQSVVIPAFVYCYIQTVISSIATAFYYACPEGMHVRQQSRASVYCVYIPLHKRKYNLHLLIVGSTNPRDNPILRLTAFCTSARKRVIVHKAILATRAFKRNTEPK